MTFLESFLPVGAGVISVALLGLRGRQVFQILSKIGVVARVGFFMLLLFVALSITGVVSVDVSRLFELVGSLISLLLGFL